METVHGKKLLCKKKTHCLTFQVAAEEYVHDGVNHSSLRKLQGLNNMGTQCINTASVRPAIISTAAYQPDYALL